MHVSDNFDLNLLNQLFLLKYHFNNIDGYRRYF